MAHRSQSDLFHPLFWITPLCSSKLIHDFPSHLRIDPHSSPWLTRSTKVWTMSLSSITSSFFSLSSLATLVFLLVLEEAVLFLPQGLCIFQAFLWGYTSSSFSCEPSLTSPMTIHLLIEDSLTTLCKLPPPHQAILLSFLLFFTEIIII